MTETFLSGGKTIRMEAHEPGPPARRQPAILLLHGSGGNTGFWLDRLAPHLASAGVSLYAPHYFDRTGTQRADFATITDGIHVPLWLDTIRAAHAAIATRPGVDPARIAVVGISLGSFLGLAWAAENSASTDPYIRSAIRCMVDLSGGLISPYAERATSGFPPTLILHGAADTIVPAQQARDLDAQLARLNVAHETRILPGEGHWFSGMAQMQLLLAVGNFLKSHL